MWTRDLYSSSAPTAQTNSEAQVLMHIQDSSRPSSRTARITALAAVVALGLAGANVFAQTVAVPTVPAAPAIVPTPTTKWTSLDASQQQALAPLSKSWDTLSEGQKRKWIAVAKSYPTLPAADQEKMHSRMVEWAALTPKDRELARLNFAQTKDVAKTDRAATWEAYQALSPEEKQKLASSAAGKPVGAAVAPKPVAKDKLAAVPVTRHTPEEQRNALKAGQLPASGKPDNGAGGTGAEPGAPVSPPKS